MLEEAQIDFICIACSLLPPAASSDHTAAIFKARAKVIYMTFKGPHLFQPPTVIDVNLQKITKQNKTGQEFLKRNNDLRVLLNLSAEWGCFLFA